MRIHFWLFVALALSSTLFGGCDSDDDTGGGPGGDAGADAGADAGPTAAFSVVTYNAGLLDSVGYVSPRAPLVVDAVAELDADIVCMQEVWEQDHWDALVDANRDVRRHVQRLEDMPGVEGQCSAEEFAPLRVCAEASCSDPGAEGLVACTTANCPGEVAALSSPCVTCLVDAAGETNDFDAIESDCVGGAGSGSNGPRPPEERSYLLGGSFGIGLLSSLTLVEQDALVLDSSTNRRGILYSKVEAPGLGELAVFCTHLTPDLPGIAYDGSFESWAGENAAHVAALIEWVDEKAGDGESVVVLGDLNTGPAGESFAAELPDSYAELPEAGLEAPYLDEPDASCTFCADNPLVLSADTGVDAVIDHVLVRDLDATVSARRIFTEAITLEPEADAGGADEAETVALSDHYGLEATVAP